MEKPYFLLSYSEEASRAEFIIHCAGLPIQAAPLSIRLSIFLYLWKVERFKIYCWLLPYDSVIFLLIKTPSFPIHSSHLTTIKYCIAGLDYISAVDYISYPFLFSLQIF